MKVLVPPLKCQGIKTKLVNWIKAQVELSATSLWIEPFTGSGVVGFNVRPARATFADINPHIINFYNALKRGDITPRGAKAFLEREAPLLAEHGANHYYAVRERFNQHGDPYDFLFLSRASFNGVLRFNRRGQYNVPFGHKPQRFAPAYITKIVNQIQYVANAIQQHDWSFVCADFRTVIPQASASDCIYCDPPYAGRHTDYFNSWSAHDEHDLFDLLSQTPARFLLSTWHSNPHRHNPLLERYAARFRICTHEHFYHVGASTANRHPMREALVCNW